MRDWPDCTSGPAEEHTVDEQTFWARALIAAIIDQSLDRDVVGMVRPIVDAEHIADPALRTALAACYASADAGNPPTSTAVTNGILDAIRDDREARAAVHAAARPSAPYSCDPGDINRWVNQLADIYGLPSRVGEHQTAYVMRDVEDTARRLRRDVHRRARVAELQRLATEAQTNPAVLQAPETLASVERLFGAPDPTESAIAMAAQWLDAADIAVEPPPTPALFTWCDTGYLAVPLGRVGVIAARGGTGKSMAMVQAGVSLATGTTWLGLLKPAKVGNTALVMAEEARAELQRRLYFATSRLVSGPERATVASRVLPIPLAGTGTHTLSDGEGNPTSSFFDLERALRSTARPDGWSLVVLDTAARFAPADAEKDASVATHFIECAERLTQLPGNPTVILVHHARKDGDGSNPADMVRGSTALVDTPRWAATMQRVDATDEVDEHINFRITKQNYGPTVGDAVTVCFSRDGVLLHARDRQGRASFSGDEPIDEFDPAAEKFGGIK